MFEKLELMQMAQNLAAHSGARLGVIARNIAQADTPGFHAQDIASFAEVYGSESAQMRGTRPGHLGGTDPMAALVPVASPGPADPNGNTVSLEREMLKAVEVRQSHDMALAIYRSTADVLRASLGRRG